VSRPGHTLAEYALATVNAPLAWAGAVLAIVAKAITPSPELGAAMLGMVGLWLLDCVLGLAVAWKGEVPWSSKRMGDSFVKLAAYLALPSSFALIKLVSGYSDHGFWSWATYAVVGLCAGREFISILENVSALGVNLPPALKKLIEGRINLLVDPKQEKKENVEGN
jgi:hypothetical protein